MKIRNKLIGLTAILMVAMFMGTSMQNFVITGNTNSAMAEVSGGSIYQGRSGNLIQFHMNEMYMSETNAIMKNITANEKSQKNGMVSVQNSIMAQYILWFLEREHITNTYRIDERFKGMANKNLFNKFLNDEPSVMSSYMSVINAEKAKAQQQNYEMGKNFINNLRNGSIKSSSGVFKSNGSELIFTHSMNGLPGPISKQTGGQWEMVDISPIYGWSPVWISTWLGGYPWVAWVPVEYIDTLNRVTIGNSAFRFYQKESGRLNGVETNLEIFFGAAGIGFGISLYAYFDKIITSADSVIISTALTVEGVLLDLWVSDISSAFTSLYTSTYVEVLNGMHGSNAGAPYMWTDYVIIDDFTSLTGSGVGVYGFKYSGATVNLFSPFPVIDFPVVSTYYAITLNSDAQNVASSVGNNVWQYEGSYS